MSLTSADNSENCSMNNGNMNNRDINNYCPVCSSNVPQFLPHGIVPRPDARCPVCNALERHRLLWAFILRCTNLLDESSKWILHFAPEPWISERLRSIPGVRYITADLQDPNADLKIDITNILYPDNCLDLIFCSHVLEHVPDDRKAMAELYRVIQPGGHAIIQIPIQSGSTFEDPSISDPKERERLFGQHDHVRIYGMDIVERLSSAGFETKLICAQDFISAEELVLFKLKPEENLIVCSKPEMPPQAN